MKILNKNNLEYYGIQELSLSYYYIQLNNINSNGNIC